MLHMKQYFLNFRQLPIWELAFYLFLIFLPTQIRIIFSPSSAYINSYFSYPLAFLVYASDILLFTAIVSYIVFSRKKYVSQLKTLYILSILMIIWVIIDLFHVKHLGLGLFQAFKWIEFILIVVFVAAISNPRIFKISGWILFISGIFQSILGILQFHVQHSVGLRLLGEYVPDALTPGAATIDVGSKLLRAYGTFPHPNVLSGFLIISLITGFYIASRATFNSVKLFSYFGLFSLYIGLFVTFSRVSWVLAGLITVLWLVRIYLRDNWKTSLKILVIAFVSCGTILLLWHNLLFTRVQSLSGSKALTDRGTFDYFGIQVIKSHPFFGTGPGNYIPAIEKMFHLQPWEYQPPHNIFIYIGASLGLIGLVLFVWFLLTIFRSTWNTRPSDYRFALLLLGFSLLFMSMFDHFLVTIQQGQLLFFTSLGLMAASNNLKKPDVEQN